MADTYKINVVIGGRNYPVSVKSTEEEQGVRAAANNINKLISDYESNYAVNDKQDVLAMCALQFASFIEVNKVIKQEENEAMMTKISKLNAKLESYLDT
ncbi:cell division protein ZapA [Wenyingzhuangia sp. 2_MG-2023]|uniref:cell division protein ZapA n=1 Tax=Wenyingzhuangia sp. 2_MG-2023 TaxID=3062639 RepID=UPI0026E1FB32|nr:cell division protein ZapA [Wenyingzhuangia sp. 2_MG-2023]MDO6738970.1 cell division protein ZapA [Wenyingzhuangia sp. 2_MG-2023]MDO6803725.1 cell division protein ZapA [Wenyingzhuangia sp. 1_MG-2023]